MVHEDNTPLGHSCHHDNDILTTNPSTAITTNATSIKALLTQQATSAPVADNYDANNGFVSRIAYVDSTINSSSGLWSSSRSCSSSSSVIQQQCSASQTSFERNDGSSSSTTLENDEDDHNDDNNSQASSAGVSKTSSTTTTMSPNGHRHDKNNNSVSTNNTTTMISGGNETKVALYQLKLTVVTIMVISAIVVGFVTYWYVAQNERANFRTNYKDDADKVTQSLYAGVINTFAGLDLLSTMMVAHAKASNDTWPCTTLPYFANHAAKMLAMSAAIFFWTVMIVNSAPERLQWEQYAWDHRYIVNETLHIMETDSNFQGTIPWNIPLHRSIHSDTNRIPHNVSRRFAPIWQAYPLPGDGFTAFNWDWFTDEDPDPFIMSIETQRAVLGEPYILPDPNNAQEVADAIFWADTFSGSVRPGDNPNEPVSDILYPVINRLNQIELIDIDNDDKAKTNNHKNDTVTAVLSASFYWRDVLTNILPTGKQGLIVVIENPCTASFTYQINGPRTKYLGRGDLHDPKYGDMLFQRKFFQLDSSNTVQLRYTGIPLNTNYCTFYVTVYPSEDMEKQYTSNNPIIFAVVAFMIFVFTSTVFILYGSKVERQQQIVMSTAVRSNAVLSSLFPSSVRDKLLQQQDNSGADVNRSSSTSPAAGWLAHQSSTATTADDSKHLPKVTELRTSFGNNGGFLLSEFASQPIADLYSDTTVFFADICGFTAWSSARGPEHVFMLLESLFGEFDKAARRRKVFKVETIGDSYVAVAGLPDPMVNHAVVMVKFSRDILVIMELVAKALSITLGTDTADLQMRVGLNSGPTTAGVIRGEKSRFQLFGDTVNVASRMESTGRPGCIHCAQTTANLLIDFGKKHWLQKRQDMVHVKGKGVMDTYWIQSLSAPSHSSDNQLSNKTENT